MGAKHLRAERNGFEKKLLTSAGTSVAVDQPILRLR